MVPSGTVVVGNKCLQPMCSLALLKTAVVLHIFTRFSSARARPQHYYCAVRSCHCAGTLRVCRHRVAFRSVSSRRLSASLRQLLFEVASPGQCAHRFCLYTAATLGYLVVFELVTCNGTFLLRAFRCRKASYEKKCLPLPSRTLGHGSILSAKQWFAGNVGYRFFTVTLFR